MSDQNCPCCSGKPLDECCGPILSGSATARTPEELMRARFTAHCQKNYSFLVDSTHPEHREGVTEEEIARWASQVEWTGLDILSAAPGDSDETGQVSFEASYTIKDLPQSLREDSQFQKAGGRWYYVDGHVHGPEPYQRETPRVGRNEPCPCGSGKKFKKCCGR